MKNLFCLLCVILLTACVNSAPKIEGFKPQTYRGNELTLTGQEKNIQVGGKLRVYIDGNAKTGGLFRKKAVLEHPVAAQLAQKDKSDSILYLDRPCYFSDDEICKPIVWEEGRYMPEVIDEMLYALLNISQKYKISEFELVGYDGGGAIALLLATGLYNKKINVSKVITIAGILDTASYAHLMEEDLNPHSLNPVKEAFTLSKIPQLHIVGALDKQTPVSLAKLFKKALPKVVSFKIESYSSADHYNWAKFKMKY